MSARATRGPDIGSIGMIVDRPSGAIAIDGCGTILRDLGASCLANHNRRDSSEIPTFILPRESTSTRKEAPAFRAFNSTALKGSSKWALVFRLDFASVIKAANCWASSGEKLVMVWACYGETLGKAWARNGRCQGKHQRPAGEKSKRNRLDVGVYQICRGDLC